MKIKFYIRLALLSLTLILLFGRVSTFDNGFGKKYGWVASLQEGLDVAKDNNKPIMLIIHKSWCGACKSLKPKFEESKEIFALSRYFVMINLMDEDEPRGNDYAPDGGYIPRLLFLTPDGTVMTDVYNEVGSSQHKYFYSQTEQIVTSMKKVLKQLDVKPIKISQNNDEL